MHACAPLGGDEKWPACSRHQAALLKRHRHASRPVHTIAHWYLDFDRHEQAGPLVPPLWQSRCMTGMQTGIPHAVTRHGHSRLTNRHDCITTWHGWGTEGTRMEMLDPPRRTLPCSRRANVCVCDTNVMCVSWTEWSGKQPCASTGTWLLHEQVCHAATWRIWGHSSCANKHGHVMLLECHGPGFLTGSPCSAG